MSAARDAGGRAGDKTSGQASSQADSQTSNQASGQGHDPAGDKTSGQAASQANNPASDKTSDQAASQTHDPAGDKTSGQTAGQARAPLAALREVAPHTFIFEKRGALADAVCDDMIARFERDAGAQQPGRVGQTGALAPHIKRSTDLRVSGRAAWRDIDACLFASLSEAMRELRTAFPFFGGRFKDLGYGIQRTRPGEYYHWHIDGGSHAFAQRQLVAIWYLNDVARPGGETEFLVQRVGVRPERGKLLLFPPFWTHEHRGAAPTKGVKYIATTWIAFA